MNTKKILPSKKFMKILGGIILIILIIVLVGIVKNRKTVYKQNTEGKVVVLNEVVEKDTDNDGLKDWEESLWGTDINNPDSDKDGITDGDEVRKIQEFLGTNDKNNPDNPINDKTKTGALTRDILTIASAINQSGTITKESNDAITDEIAKYLEKSNVLKYSSTDLNIINTPTKKDIQTYFDLIKQSWTRAYTTKEDLLLIYNYEKSMDAGTMTLYSDVSKKFFKEKENLLKMKVPSDYILIHLDYLNSVLAIASLYDDLSKSEEDPATALSAFISLKETLSTYKNAMQQVDIEAKKVYNHT
jgi:hypothetical protein